MTTELWARGDMCDDRASLQQPPTTTGIQGKHTATPRGTIKPT